jgi:SAM-dependent methyltransferase
MDDSSVIGSSPATWDAMAQGYDAERTADPVYDACIRQAVADLHPAGTVLDCGCGTGLATRHLLCADSVHGLDFSRQMLKQIRRRFGARHVKTMQGDVRELPYPDAMFDCVLVANVLQHLARDDQRRAATEIMRVLKPDGRFSVSVHHYSVEKQRAGWIKEGKPGGKDGCDYIFRYTRSELAALFPSARIRAVGFYNWPAQMLITRTAGHTLARRGHGHMILAYGVARKFAQANLSVSIANKSRRPFRGR